MSNPRRASPGQNRGHCRSSGRLILLSVALLLLISRSAWGEAQSIDPAAQLPAGGSASEYWDLAVELRSGHAIFARFMITNEGPSHGNGVAVGHLVDPEGNTTKFRNGRLRRRWELSSDQLRLDIGKSHLDLHPPGWRLLVRKSEIKLDIRVEAAEGARIPAAVTGPDYHVDLVGLGAAATGSVWSEGMSQPLEVAGRATLVHALLAKSEADLVARRVEAITQMGDYSLYFCEFRDPGGRTRSWLATRANPMDRTAGTESPALATLWHRETSSDEVSTQFEGKTTYPIPKEIAIQAAELQARIRIGDEILRHNPLEDLPGPVRWVLGLRMKPMRVWSRARFVGTLGPGRKPGTLQSGNRGMAADPRSADSSRDAETGSTSRATQSNRNRSENTGVVGVVTTSYLNPNN